MLRHVSLSGSSMNLKAKAMVLTEACTGRKPFHRIPPERGWDSTLRGVCTKSPFGVARTAEIYPHSNTNVGGFTFTSLEDFNSALDRIDSMSSNKQTNGVGELDEVHLQKSTSLSALTADGITESALRVTRAAILPDTADLHSKLQRSDALLAMAQSLTGTGCFGWGVASGEVYWSEQTYKIFEYDRAANLTLEMVLQRIHPDDRDHVQQT